MTTPEFLARENIDAQLTACGWVIQDRTKLNLHVGRGVAVRQFPLQTGFADYLLFVDRMAIVAEVERRLSVAQEVESVVAASRLRQSVLKSAFEGDYKWILPN
jgi:type I restriction enzyme R subunit